jgi:hypothetical protein
MRRIAQGMRDEENESVKVSKNDPELGATGHQSRVDRPRDSDNRNLLDRGGLTDLAE